MCFKRVGHFLIKIILLFYNNNNGKEIIKFNITYFVPNYALISVFNFIKSAASSRTFKSVFQIWLDACPQLPSLMALIQVERGQKKGPNFSPRNI